ncbi:MAG: hypothetical protein WCC74_02155 [Minisyncoccia bacterium]
MKIEVSKEQLKEMILSAMFYSWVRGGLADQKGEDFNQYEKLENFLLKIADENGFSDLAEKFHNTLVPTDELSELLENTMEEHDEDVFWHELTTALGKRDFYRTVTKEEKKEMEEKNWLPDRIHTIYKKYEEEFEKHGIDRLDIKEK